MHFYGEVLHEGKMHRVRIFAGPVKKPDLKIAGLFELDSDRIASSGLRLLCEIKDSWPDKSIKWSGPALPISDQSIPTQDMVEYLLEKHAQSSAYTELRSPYDVVTITTTEPETYDPNVISRTNQPNQIKTLGLAAYEGKNPMELLTPSTARVQGKTDYALMCILRVCAEKLNVEVCDLINEVMWDSVRSGRVWACQRGHGMP